MRKMTTCVGAALLAMFGCAGGGSAAPPAAPAQAIDSGQLAAAEAALVGIPNAKRPLPYLVTGGAPSEANLSEAQAKGFHTVISLLPETMPEQAQVERLGMRFVSIPIASAGDLTEQNARRLGEALSVEGERPMILHCASGNRAGALLALAAFYVEGTAPDASLALGVSAGLTGLEPEVRERLGLGAAPSSH